jgi:malate permease and related proteins
MSGSIVLNQVVILFLIMLVGFTAKKRNILNEAAGKKLSELLLYITSPFLIITSFQTPFSRDMLWNAGTVFLFSMGAHGFSVLLGKLLYCRYPENTKRVLKFVSIYSNCGFMGFPVLEGLFGKIGIFYGSIYVMAFNIFIWTNGVMIFTGKKDWKMMRKALFNPGIISVFLGMILFLFSLRLPLPVFRAVELVGGMTVPLSMLIIGALLADADIKGFFSGLSVYYGTFVRLLLIPMIALVVLKVIGFPGQLLQICVLLVAMPAAANTAIFAEMYGADSQLASRCIVISTLLSIITIPLIVLWL